MMKYEFEERLGYEVTDEEYKVIEYVYMWHPVFDGCAHPKDKIVNLYDDFGMSVIMGMRELAEAYEELDTMERQTLAELDRIRARQTRVATGDISLEKDIKLIDDLFDKSDSLSDWLTMLSTRGFERDCEAVVLGGFDHLMK